MILLTEMKSMQNTVSDYINSKIINIRSEVLFREAEDEFFYFYNINSAMRKLKKAIEYTPYHLKSIVLYADICYLKGKFDKALNLYFLAVKIKGKDIKLLASIANCYNSLKKFDESLEFCNAALKNIGEDSFLLSNQVIELKINNLVSLKRFDEANRVLVQFSDLLKENFAGSLYATLNEKIKLYEKLRYSGLKIV